MKLNFEQIKAITTGAVEFKNDENGISFLRFTREQREHYNERSENYYRNTYSTAGIKLCFRTDSEKLYLKILAERASSRFYFSLDVLVDGKYIDSIDNFSDMEIAKNYHAMRCEVGQFEKRFPLGQGVKNICIHLPWSMVTTIVDMELDDAAIIEPIKQAKKLLAFGDSITQGYDALRPSKRYIANIAEALDAEEINKAIGGERFWPQLAALKDDFSPDYITVAYGTNDWSRSRISGFENFEGFLENCNSFFDNLRKNYPDAKIFAITPIWREDKDTLEADWKFDDSKDIISRIVKAYNVEVIDGGELLPHDTDLFGDLRLHPNDDGFKLYFENLYRAIKNKI
ncbi:MAG: SGNH/GDSL hydrolase family protein [Oscillospiraceae bacterium]|nr:SGNH/GDSL hydrolase family protein [Oscillospiraceae bacterium]